MARFQFFSHDRLTDRRLTDRQNRLLNPASRMLARVNYSSELLLHTLAYSITFLWLVGPHAVVHGRLVGPQ